MAPVAHQGKSGIFLTALWQARRKDFHAMQRLVLDYLTFSDVDHHGAPPVATAHSLWTATAVGTGAISS